MTKIRKEDAFPAQEYITPYIAPALHNLLTYLATLSVGELGKLPPSELEICNRGGAMPQTLFMAGITPFRLALIKRNITFASYTRASNPEKLIKDALITPHYKITKMQVIKLNGATLYETQRDASQDPTNQISLPGYAWIEAGINISAGQKMQNLPARLFASAHPVVEPDHSKHNSYTTIFASLHLILDPKHYVTTDQAIGYGVAPGQQSSTSGHKRRHGPDGPTPDDF